MVNGATGTSIGDQRVLEWIAVEHYRLHSVERLPDGPYKRATLEAIHSSLGRLMGSVTGTPDCNICFNRRNVPGVIAFPTESRLPRPTTSSVKRMAS